MQHLRASTASVTSPSNESSAAHPTAPIAVHAEKKVSWTARAATVVRRP